MAELSFTLSPVTFLYLVSIFKQNKKYDMLQRIRESKIGENKEESETFRNTILIESKDYVPVHGQIS